MKAFGKEPLPTGIRLLDFELSPNGKRIKNLAKARLIESKRRELQDKLDSLMVDAIGRHLDADDIVERITVPASGDLGFFCFACYKRTKTRDRRSDNAYIEVRVHPCIDELFRKYASDSRVFNFYRRYSSAYDFNAAINKGLKEVGRAVGVEGLNFYQARHTFATLSRNLMRFSKSDVDEALSHVGGMDLADVYIAKDFSIINDNNARLLERVFGQGLRPCERRGAIVKL